MDSKTPSIAKTEKIVVFFDICSSTTLLEAMLDAKRPECWRKVLIGLEKFLSKQIAQGSFEIHKFIGDGWVLFFPHSTNGDHLLNLLREICREYERLYLQYIHEHLDDSQRPFGLTFGVASGRLLPVLMTTGQTEYFGRPLNIAARLQSAIKHETKDPNPQGKVLISKRAFWLLDISLTGRNRGKFVRRELRNIRGGNRYRARKVVLHKQAQP